MQFSITALLFGLVAISSAAITDVEGVRNTPRNVIETRQVPNGQCCFPNQSLKQQPCTVNGADGKCVPGGPGACNGALNCVSNDQLVCDNNIPERAGVLCRFQLPNGRIQDGANQITSLSQAKVN
ncbi:hypothetical protein COCMIDRAFT_81284 [Bipolaris oryzae ATCC 44560]|uniref:Uncharacterized protein n=1 Tax=Bipolaris oryzae ATCC 44560 TaxID=930090 RepID=W7A3V3_COCMI|nr:uncharacterized protein COCMIDRAFT_81284 [Bipolaris oryzae ATCC 44560]EUC50691.1 hypothetical protein COCMIDRAFT_81284 [Bipolaris oryzae ATCC 44560]